MRIIGQIIRWILVLPVSAAAYYIVQVINAFITSYLPHFMDWAVQLFNSMAGPVAFIALGTWCAPKFKPHTGTALAIVNALCTVAIGVLLFTYPPMKDLPKIWTLICAAVSLAVSVGAFCFFLENGKKIESGE